MTLTLTLDDCRGLLATLPDPAFVLTVSGRYAAVYGGTDTRYYHDGTGLVGLRLHDVMRADKADWFLAQIAVALQASGLHVIEYELSNRDVRGLPDEGPAEPIWFEGRVKRLPFAVEGEPAVLWVASNITARHGLEQQLRDLSETDELTGLANRRRVMAELQVQFDAFTRYGHTAAVIYLDVDRFKAINDQLGHGAGDDALRAVARTLRGLQRRTDVVARLGGDEFVLVCPHTGIAEAAGLAQRLCAPLTDAMRAFALPAGPPASVSIGYAAMAAGDTGHMDVLRRADESLYRVKGRLSRTAGVSDTDAPAGVVAAVSTPSEPPLTR